MLASLVQNSTVARLYRHRDLIVALVRKDVVGRYRGSVMGLFWTILNPLFMLVLYTFLFGTIMKVRFASHGVAGNFTLYLLCGMLPWLAFSEGVNRAVICVLENQNLVKKVVFPLEILPVNVVFSALISEFFAMIVLLIAIVLVNHSLPWTILFLPLVLLPQLCLTLGLAWCLASVGVFIRDLGQFTGLVLTAWMFATPIMYPETMVPARYNWVLLANPMAVFVAVYRGLFLEGQLVHWKWLLAWSVPSVALMLLGHSWFTRTQKGFADVL